MRRSLKVFRENDWIDGVGSGQTTISVVVKQPKVEHKVRVLDFERWLASQGRTPAEVSLKGRLRKLLERGPSATSAPVGSGTDERAAGL
jgi:hypothetical protein